VVLTVNGRKQSPGTSQPVTLSIGPAQKVSATTGLAGTTPTSGLSGSTATGG
jgi:hypothetical protein